jgi:uncharacterized protein (TIGR00369 family)
VTTEMNAPYGAGSAAWIEWADALVGSKAAGLRCRSITPGEAELVLESSPLGLNVNGAVHGGLVAYVVDQVMGIVVTSALPEGQVAVTSTLSMEYHWPARLPLVFRGRATRVGRAVAFVDVDVESDGRICSRGRGSMVPRRAVPDLSAISGNGA